MLSIILNIITILIVIAMIVLFLRLYYNKKSKTVDVDDEEVTASQVAQDIIKDPLVVSRAYFTEPRYGDIGTFI